MDGQREREESKQKDIKKSAGIKDMTDIIFNKSIKGLD